MKKSIMITLCFASVGITALTVLANHLLNKTNNVFLNFLFFLPMLTISFLMLYLVNKKDKKKIILNFRFRIILPSITAVQIVILPIFIHSLSSNALYLSNVFTYFVTYIYASGMTMRKITNDKRVATILTIISNLIYWWVLILSVINCFFNILEFEGLIIA